MYDISGEHMYETGRGKRFAKTPSQLVTTSAAGERVLPGD
jgi:hypothetical protein